MTIHPEMFGDFYVQWHITNRCNLRCSHCYQTDYGGENELPFEEIKSIAQEIFKTLAKWKKLGDFSITGGEPFLRKDIFEILDLINSSKDVSRLDILSNGTLITQDIISKLKSFSKLRYVQISLDGSSPEMHDKIRGEGSFDKAMIGIRNLIDNDIETRLMFTLQRSNITDIPSIIDLAIDTGIGGLTIERMVPTGSGKQADLLTTNEIKSVMEYVSTRADIEYENGTKLKILKYRPLWINIDPCRSKTGCNTPVHKDLGGICSLGLDGICILPDATVLGCRRLPIPIGNLQQDSMEKIWTQSKLLWEIRDKNNLKGKCHSCSYIPRCGGCRSMAYAYYGDYLAEDPHCWKDFNIAKSNDISVT